MHISLFFKTWLGLISKTDFTLPFPWVTFYLTRVIDRILLERDFSKKKLKDAMLSRELNDSAIFAVAPLPRCEVIKNRARRWRVAISPNFRAGYPITEISRECFPRYGGK